MRGIKKGAVDYDYDRYGRKIRKYVATEAIKAHGKKEFLWEQVLEFKPEKEVTKKA